MWKQTLCSGKHRGFKLGLKMLNLCDFRWILLGLVHARTKGMFSGHFTGMQAQGQQKQIRVKLKPKLSFLGRSTIQVDLALAGAQKTTQHVLSIPNFHLSL